MSTTDATQTKVAMMKEKQYFVRLRVVAIVVLSLTVGVNLLPADMTLFMVVENGPIEMLSALGLLAAAFWLFGRVGHDASGQPMSAGILVLLLGLRELDFHARFTTMGVFKTKYYISSAVPVGEKAMVSLIMICILIIALRFLMHNFGAFALALRRRRPIALAILAAIGYGLLGKGLDSFSTPLEPIIAFFSSNPKLFLRAAEECVELGTPICILLALYYASGLYRSKERVAAEEI